MIEVIKNRIVARVRTASSSYERASWVEIKRFGELIPRSAVFVLPAITMLISIYASTNTGSGQSGVSAFGKFLFYSASLLLIVASLLFNMKCPIMIRRYENNLEYVKSELEVLRNPILLTNIISFMYKRHDKHSYELREQKLDREVDEFSQSLEAVRLALQKPCNMADEQLVAKLMLTHWEFMNRSNPISRLIILLAFYIGFALFISSVIAFAKSTLM